MKTHFQETCNRIKELSKPTSCLQNERHVDCMIGKHYMTDICICALTYRKDTYVKLGNKVHAY